MVDCPPLDLLSWARKKNKGITPPRPHLLKNSFIDQRLYLPAGGEGVPVLTTTPELQYVVSDT